MAEWNFRIRAKIDDETGQVTKMTTESLDEDLAKVGPKGYVHGWIKVGLGGNNPRPGMGDISVDPKDIEALRHSTAGKYLDKDGRLSPERQKLHDSIVTSLTSHAEPSASPHMIIMGGGPASGKSSMIADGKVSLDNAVHVDPDEIKGMLPEVKEMQAAGDDRWAALSHEESSYLAKRVTAAALESKKNVLLDGTGDSERSKILGKITTAKAHGYKVDGHYAAVTIDTALQRAEARAQKTGRRVPEDTIRNTYAGISEVLPTVADNFDSLNIYDNNGKSLRLIARSGPKGLSVIDPDAYKAFLDNAGGRIA